MCGISGFLTQNKSTTKNILRLSRMTSKLSHRGPDSMGSWSDNNNGIYLGHTRLSIIDLTKKGNQPMVSKNGRYVIVFNGEIYNFKKLRNFIINKTNIKFSNNTDTVVLLELINLLGIKEALKLVQGMYSIGVWDKETKNLYLARDKFGEKPLFYYIDSTQFIFASELKSIKSYFESQKLKIDEESVKLFSSLGYIPAPKSIFKNTFKVMPNQILTFNSGKIIKKTLIYQKNTNAYEHDQLESKLEESVTKMMVADVEIGCFLSGGIDSSLVASIMQKNSSKKIKTYSIGFHEDEYDESVYAKNIAKYLNTDHHEIKLSVNDLIENIYKIPQIFDEPFGDSSCLPTEIICKYASKDLKVVLSGDGADEIFLGYNRYLFGHKIKKLNQYMPLIIRKFLSLILKIVPNRVYDYISGPVKKSFGLQGFSHKIEKIRKILEFDSNADFYKKLNIIDNEMSEFLNTESNIFKESNELDFIESIQYNDINYYLSNDILVKVDRCSMFHSLEVRAPFLDINLTEIASNISVKDKLKNKKLKYITRNILKNYLPEKLFERPKMGFGIPIDKWLDQKETSKIFDEIFYETDWSKVYMEKPDVIRKWQSYKKFKNFIPALIWNYAIIGLWVRNN